MDFTPAMQRCAERQPERRHPAGCPCVNCRRQQPLKTDERNTTPSLFTPDPASPELRGQGPADQKAPDASMRPELEQRTAARAQRAARAQKEDSKRFLVRVTSRRGRLIDEDNLCEKYVVDCCRYAGLLPGDGPGQTKIEVRQEKVGSAAEECTVIEIFEVNDRPGIRITLEGLEQP